MHEHLETADHPDTLRRLVIDPVSRVEGHGKVTLLLDAAGQIRQARLHIVEFRGFEKFIEGRPYQEVPVLVQRLCGICPVSHLLAATKAADRFATGSAYIPPAALQLRRLLHFGQVLQSHALHFFHLASPDLLFGDDTGPAQRNVFGVLASAPEVGMMGIRLRQYGQEVIRVLTGKRVHGTGALPGGFNKPLSAADRQSLQQPLPEVLSWAQQGVTLARELFLRHAGHAGFAAARSPFLSLVAADGAFELYDGKLRVKAADGTILLDQFDPSRYTELLREEVKPWTYLKFPYLLARGPADGWYRVGPLARLNNCDYMPTPLAEAARQDFMAYGAGQPVHATLAYHWARMIELLHCAEAIADSLAAPAPADAPLLATGHAGVQDSVGMIEAPRGTLLHHYRIDDNGLITTANLIVSTTHNNQAMNESVRAAAAELFDGREISEALLNRIEVAIRAYDPCLSCATHALGQMPLQVELLDAQGRCLARRSTHHGEMAHG